MNTIKFSHEYIKYPEVLESGDTVQLLEVLNGKFEDLHESFIEYDTTTKEAQKYKLPKKGDCLILLLFGTGLSFDKGELFTTIRRHTPQKEQYYKSLRGKMLKVVINDD